MAQELPTTLDVIYENWHGYGEKVQKCISPLTKEQLLLQPAPDRWPLGQIVQHMISVRAGWFSCTLQDPDDLMNEYTMWGQRGSPDRSAAELVQGLKDTWTFIESRLHLWTPVDCAKNFPDEWEGETYEVSRNWVIYHLLEHDMYHGSQISLTLDVNGLQTLEI